MAPAEPGRHLDARNKRLLADRQKAVVPKCSARSMR
jgi:hypothetical protein